MHITSAKFITSSPDWQKCPPADLPEFVFIGRSNVGKSSLINSVCNKKDLAKISIKPGKTQLINHFALTSEDEEKNAKSRYLVDLPGYGYAKASRTARLDWEDMITDYLIHRTNIAEIFVLVDSSIPPQTLDLGFIKRLYENGKTCTIVFTKSDKATQKDLHKNLKTFSQELSKKIHPFTMP